MKTHYAQLRTHNNQATSVLACGFVARPNGRSNICDMNGGEEIKF
jgi:hypothetical protein